MDLACFHGKTFWRVCLAGLFGGSVWLIHLAGFQGNEKDMLLSKKKKKKSNEMNHGESVDCNVIM